MAGRDRGPQRRRFHARVRHERVPGPHRRRGQGLRSERRPRAGEGDEADRPQRPVRARGGEGGARRRRQERLPARPRRASCSAPASAGCTSCCASTTCCKERGPGPGLADVPPERPSRLGERPGGDRARNPRARTTPSSRPARPGSHAIGEGAELVRHGHADAVLAGGTEACIHPLFFAGLLLDARSRRRGGGSGEGMPPVRCDAGPGS